MNNYRRHSFELKPLLEKRHEVAKTIGLKKKARLLDLHLLEFYAIHF
jgi:hypothetical protein